MCACHVNATSSAPLRIGLIADIQYADIEDGSDYSGRETRRYRRALSLTKAAVDVWNAAGVEVVVQLGDIIDGHNATQGCGTSAALSNVLAELERCNAQRRYDLIGNHELYNVLRESLPTSGLRCLGPEGKTYRSEPLNDHWQAVILDPYEVSLLGFGQDSGSPEFQEATGLMQNFNPKAMEGSGNWFDGLSEEMHRYVPYNGGVSQTQLYWLRGALKEASDSGRKVLVFTHVPLYVSATTQKTLAWNADEILDVLHQHRDCVVAVFAGHDHNGGYAVDDAGLHHVTMNSPLTAPAESDSCCAVLECHGSGEARFVAHGRACVESFSRGEGRAYSELRLARGARNEPSLPALPTDGAAADGAAADGAAADGAAAMRAARLARLDPKAAEREAEALRHLLEAGFPEDRARASLEAANGQLEVAMSALIGS